MNCHLAGLSLSQGSVGGHEAFALDHPAFLRSATEAPETHRSAIRPHPREAHTAGNMNRHHPTTTRKVQYSAKHRRHGVNVQVVTDPSGQLLWLSSALPGRSQRPDRRSHPQDHPDL